MKKESILEFVLIFFNCFAGLYNIYLGDIYNLPLVTFLGVALIIEAIALRVFFVANNKNKTTKINLDITPEKIKEFTNLLEKSGFTKTN